MQSLSNVYLTELLSVLDTHVKGGIERDHRCGGKGSYLQAGIWKILRGEKDIGA